MSTHNIGFYEEMMKIIFQISSNAHFICSSETTLLIFSVGDISTRPPHLGSEYFNPSQQILQTHRYYSTKKSRFPWSRTMFRAEFDDKLEVPLPIPHPAIIAISVYNRLVPHPLLL